MIDYKWDPESLTHSIRTYGNLKAAITRDTIGAFRDSLGIIRSNVHYRIPVDKGPLADSLSSYVYDMRPDQGIIEGKVTMWPQGGKQLPYAWMREKGGTIRPRADNPLQRLVWRDPHSGDLIFARQVTQQGSHYMERGGQESVPAVRETFIRALTGTFEVFD